MKNIEIKHDTTIQSTKPIVVQGGIKVNEGATLTIGAGTTLYFSNKAGIDVHGQAENSRNSRQDCYASGRPFGLYVRLFAVRPCERTVARHSFNTSSYDNEIEFADIHSTYNGIVCDSSSIDRSTLFASSEHHTQLSGIWFARHRLQDRRQQQPKLQTR